MNEQELKKLEDKLLTADEMFSLSDQFYEKYHIEFDNVKKKQIINIHFKSIEVLKNDLGPSA